MRYVLNMERVTIANLTLNNERRSFYWPLRLGRRIPHLDQRLVLLLDSPMCRDLLEDDEEGPETPIEDLVSTAQLALLALELAVGVDYIQDQMDGKYPSSFLAAVCEVFENMQSWISMDPETNTEDPAHTAVSLISYFVSIYAFNKTVEDDVMDDPEYEKESKYPPEKVATHCDAILDELDIPIVLNETLLSVIQSAQLMSEVTSLRPTFN